MRNILLALLTSLSSLAQAQLWEHAIQHNEEMLLNRALPLGGGRWAAIGRAAWAGSYMMRVYNGDGSLAWEHMGPYATCDLWGDVTLMPDSGLLQVGVQDGCDYFSDNLARCYAPDGSLLWERNFQPDLIHPFTMAAGGSTQYIAVASADSVCVLDLNGDLVNEFYIPTGNLSRIIWAGDSTLFLVHGSALELVDLNGNIQASTSFAPTVQDMYWNGQQLFLLSNDSIHLFDPDLAPLGQASLPGVNGYSRFVAADSSLFVNTFTGLREVADGGTSTLLFPWPLLSDQNTTGCAVRNGGVFTVGNTVINGMRTGVARTLSLTGDAAQHDEDVEVILQVDSSWTQNPSPPYWQRQANITGRVVNHGSDTLRSIVLSMWYYVPQILCGNPTNRIDTAGFALAPGDTITLPFGTVNVALGLYPNEVVGSANICIAALAPDSLVDRNPGDNTACDSIDFVLGVEAFPRTAPLALAPNPAVNTCVLSGLTALGTPVHVRIMDLTGRVVVEQNSIGSSQNVELDISSLAPATFLVVAEGPNSRAMAKLVVARP